MSKLAVDVQHGRIIMLRYTLPEGSAGVTIWKFQRNPADNTYTGFSRKSYQGQHDFRNETLDTALDSVHPHGSAIAAFRMLLERPEITEILIRQIGSELGLPMNDITVNFLPSTR